MICSACEARNPPGATGCHRCEAPLPPSCAACDAPLAAGEAGDDDELCPRCRARDLEQAMLEEPLPDDGIDELPADAIDGAERTVITALPFELRPRYTGRGEALGRLLAAYQACVADRRLVFALIVAEPGLGKSRTLAELGRLARDAQPDGRVLIAAAEPSGGPYDVFARLLARRFGIAPSDAAEDAQEKIVAGVAEVMPAARVSETAHLVAHLMRLSFAASPIVSPLLDTPQQLEARTFLALRRFLAADAERAPLLLGVENLELCEPESINLLHYLVAGLSRAPVALVGTARAQLFERHPSFGETDAPLEKIELGPLSPAETDALLAELGRAIEKVPDRLVAHARRLGGSPRALFELMRLLVETDVIQRGGGASWHLDEARLARARLPNSHGELVAARVAVMPEADRATLEMAAAVGETFWLDGVVALVRVGERDGGDPDGPTLADIAAAGDRSRIDVADALGRLTDREWIEEVEPSSVPGEREYRFAYPYLWQTVYDGVDPARRRRYHKFVAQYLELRPESRAALAQEDVGNHLEKAGDQAGAAARYRRAGDVARAGFANQRAIRLYSQALACLGEADLAARIHLWHDLGSVYELKGDYEAALGAFERMLRLAWVCASRTKAAVAFNKMGRVWRRKGDLKLALEYLERGRELFEQADDARGIAGSLDDIGSVLYLLGRYDDAYEKVTQGLARRGRGGDKRSIAHSLSNLGNIQKDRGRLPEAETCHREALELRRAIGDRVGVIASLNNLAALAFEHGDVAGARKGYEQALREAEEVGALPLQALALANLGELALGEDRQEEARRRLEEALEISREIADRRLEVEATRTLALLEHRAANATRARELAQRAYQTAASAGLREIEGRALLTLGEVFGGTVFDAAAADRPQPAEAQADSYFARGVEILRHIGNPGELARGLERYGLYRIEHGDLPGGKHLLEEARQLFGRLGLERQSQIERVLASV
jgi:tetratricopeptide (TPR) repeat protein